MQRYNFFLWHNIFFDIIYHKAWNKMGPTALAASPAISNESTSYYLMEEDGESEVQAFLSNRFLVFSQFALTDMGKADDLGIGIGLRLQL